MVSLEGFFSNRLLSSVCWVWWSGFFPFAYLGLFSGIVRRVSMSAAMDKAMLAMSLGEEEDEPFIMPDLPEFYSCEKNAISVIGRALNPDCQKMSSLIMDMPRKWQKLGRVRGVALSKERFQFIFNTEHDLVETLEKGFHTYNEWGLAVEKYVVTPPSDYLQFVPIWVQIRNIPVNHYTVQAITALGELVGQVLEVVLDESKAQNQDFVRVKVKFDISKPLRRSKVITLPRGQSTTIFFFYERVQKRCYSCQRLTHAQETCHFLLKKRQDLEDDRRSGKVQEKSNPPLILKESDPLHGVLREDQVGVNPITGRVRIAPEVLQGLRQYLLVASGEDRKLKEDKVKNSVGEAERDPIAQKTVLRLEPAPIVSHDLNKGKGIVFGYESESSSAPVFLGGPNDQVMMERDFKSYQDPILPPPKAILQARSEPQDFSGLSSGFHVDSTGYRIGFSEASPSGVYMKNVYRRKRPSKRKRKLKGKSEISVSESIIKVGVTSCQGVKRKAYEELEGVSKAARSNIPEMVPKEGPSNA